MKRLVVSWHGCMGCAYLKDEHECQNAGSALDSVGIYHDDIQGPVQSSTVFLSHEVFVKGGYCMQRESLAIEDVRRVK